MNLLMRLSIKRRPCLTNQSLQLRPIDDFSIDLDVDGLLFRHHYRIGHSGQGQQASDQSLVVD